MKLMIHRGAKEIGGNCVEVATENTRLVIDVGLPLAASGGNPIRPKDLQRQNIPELMTRGVVPAVPGLFQEGPALDAILLSHAHLDHSGLLHLTKDNIPIYLGRGTSKMLLAGSLFAGQASFPRERKRIFAAGQTFQIGDLSITPLAVDHSVFDSYALLIEAEGKRVLYSGDLRIHGRKPGMHRQLVRRLGAAPIDVLLMEGTHLGSHRERGCSEQELEEQIVTQIQTAPGLVLASFSPMHVDRLVTFYRATRRAGRTLIVDPYTAFVMHLVASQCRIPRPSERAGIRVYFNRHFENRSTRNRGLKKIREMFQEERIEVDVLAEPGKYVQIFRPSMLEPDFGNVFLPGTRCIYSYWSGYRSNPDWVAVTERVQAAGGDVVELHTSGHIWADDLVGFVASIRAKVVIPIHTQQPQQFQELFQNAQLLPDGEWRTIE